VTGDTYTPLVDITTSIADATGTGAIIRPVVTVVGGVAGVRGYEVVKGGSGYTAPVITVVRSGGPGVNATSTVTLSTSSPTSTALYPVTVTYFQQRKVFGGSTSFPNTLWMTKPGSYQNMDVSLVSRDDDALTLPLVSDQVNAINNMVSVTSGLLVFTNYGIWLVNGGQVGAAVTPNQILASAQDYGGSADIQPLKVLYEVLYIQAKGNVVRNLSFNFQTNVFQGNDLTIFSNHFFTGFTTLRWTYADSPWKIVWAVRSDGALLSMTYLKEQELFGWTKHDTDGLFSSICSITQSNIDAVYFIVKRTIGGNVLAYVEKLASRMLSDSRVNGWFLDSALQTTLGAPTATITGLWHLEGKVVGGLVGGLTEGAHTVTNGTITLSATAGAGTVVTIGLPYQSQVKTLALDTSVSNTIQGKRKNIPAYAIRMVDTYGLKIGSTTVSGNLFQAWKIDVQNFVGTIKNDGTNGSLYSGDLRRTISEGWNEQSQVLLEMDEPYPFHVTGIIPEFALGDAKIREKGAQVNYND
jgi:hypothetical protein